MDSMKVDENDILSTSEEDSELDENDDIRSFDKMNFSLLYATNYDENCDENLEELSPCVLSSTRRRLRPQHPTHHITSHQPRQIVDSDVLASCSSSDDSDVPASSAVTVADDSSTQIRDVLDSSSATVADDTITQIPSTGEEWMTQGDVDAQDYTQIPSSSTWMTQGDIEAAMNPEIVENLDQNQPLRTYLVTYSQCDEEKFPTRKSFGDAVADCFRSDSSKVVPTHWACCREDHHVSGGKHYHVSIALSGPKKWVMVRRKLQDLYGIRVHFSTKGSGGYHSAFMYVIKEDAGYYTSTPHPTLDELKKQAEKTKRCMTGHATRRMKRRSSELAASSSAEKSSGKEKKSRRITNFDISEFIFKQNITNIDELLSFANEQKVEGKIELATYVMSKTAKQLTDLVEMTWRMAGAKKTVERQKSDRLGLLQDAFGKPCTCTQSGEWYELAIETLQNNSVNKFVFAHSIRDLLKHGRSKNRNLMIVGKSNCAKSFLFLPLEIIYNTFANPANNKYGWINVDRAEVILLNDIRWSPELIVWDDFLRLLEGHVVNLPAPKNHYSQDIRMDKDTPIFATSKAEITYLGTYQKRDEMEDEMMAIRWKTFTFTHRIPRDEMKDIKPCAKCFATMVKLGDDE